MPSFTPPPYTVPPPKGHRYCRYCGRPVEFKEIGYHNRRYHADVWTPAYLLYHGDPYPFKCYLPGCGLAFRKHSDLRVHQENHSPFDGKGGASKPPSTNQSWKPATDATNGSRLFRSRTRRVKLPNGVIEFTSLPKPPAYPRTSASPPPSPLSSAATTPSTTDVDSDGEYPLDCSYHSENYVLSSAAFPDRH